MVDHEDITRLTDEQTKLHPLKTGLLIGAPEALGDA